MVHSVLHVEYMHTKVTKHNVYLKMHSLILTEWCAFKIQINYDFFAAAQFHVQTYHMFVKLNWAGSHK